MERGLENSTNDLSWSKLKAPGIRGNSWLIQSLISRTLIDVSSKILTFAFSIKCRNEKGKFRQGSDRAIKKGCCKRLQIYHFCKGEDGQSRSGPQFCLSVRVNDFESLELFWGGLEDLEKWRFHQNILYSPRAGLRESDWYIKEDFAALNAS